MVLANCAPATLDRLLGRDRPRPRRWAARSRSTWWSAGCPGCAPASTPRSAFAGTLHLGQGYARLQQAYEEAAAGRIPDPLPCEVYCHSLTDPSILGDDLRAAGYHTLTLFGLHTPVGLFRADPDRRADTGAPGGAARRCRRRWPSRWRTAWPATPRARRAWR